jgi:hypothetical protein
VLWSITRALPGGSRDFLALMKRHCSTAAKAWDEPIIAAADKKQTANFMSCLLTSSDLDMCRKIVPLSDVCFL